MNPMRGHEFYILNLIANGYVTVPAMTTQAGIPITTAEIRYALTRLRKRGYIAMTGNIGPTGVWSLAPEGEQALKAKGKQKSEGAS